MITSSSRKHAGPGPASDQPPVPEPTFAERARTYGPGMKIPPLALHAVSNGEKAVEALVI